MHEGPKMSGGKRAVFRSRVPVDRATDLPQRRILVSRLLKLTSQIGRELAHAAEVVGPELGEDPFAVFIRRSTIVDRDRGEPPGMPRQSRERLPR
jgi:hypothetical protein